MLSNAFRFQAPDQPCEIHPKTYKQASFVVLSVKDNNLGISEKHQSQLVSMFKRFHNHVEGTGTSIGFYMIKRMVENAGGKIEVESEEGVGTEFKIYFQAV